MSIRAPSCWRLKLVQPFAALSAALLVAACQGAPPPPPPAPDPGPPPAPTPPLGAAHGIYIPAADPETGERKTPNSDIDSDETLWHFRSAFNVAALSCTSAAYPQMTERYGLFLTNAQAPLKRVNRAIDARFRKAFPAVNGLRVRDTHMTQLYNYFALPPTIGLLCQLMDKYSIEATMIKEPELYPFAAKVLQEIDDIFIKFYEDYEDYLRRLAEWEALYGLRGQVVVGGGALYSANPTGPVKPKATSERTGADFTDMPPTIQMPSQGAPAFPTEEDAQVMDDGLPANYRPSMPAAGDAQREGEPATNGSTTPPASDSSGDVFGRPAGE